MAPPDAGGSKREDPHGVLERVEERVRKVQHLEPFHFSRRGDGRFQCALEKPLRDLSAEQIRHALAVLESVTEVLEARLEEIGNG